MNNKVSTEFAKLVAEHHKQREAEHPLPPESDANSLAAWFLGPKAENKEMLADFIQQAVEAHCKDRTDYFPEDPVYVTDEIKQSREFGATRENFQAHLEHMLLQLRGSIPLASYRNQSHMYWDITLPGSVGYFAAMLYNQNNVAVEASPVTTYLEMVVGDDLCEMLGFHVPDEDEVQRGVIKPWGHITCDGSVANLESMWAARNLKYYPVTIAEALKNESSLSAARGLRVPLPGHQERARLIDLDGWSLLNIRVDDVIALAPRIQQDYGISADDLNKALENYSLQSVGIGEFNRRFLADLPHQLPLVFVPSTAHYSWPKGAAILGLGSNTVENIHIDLDCRMSAVHLRARLDECLEKKQPVMQVVAVVGSTEESAVDPLAEIVAMREEYRQDGLEFALHVDGAWGGYFASMLRGGGDMPTNLARELTPDNLESTPAMVMSSYLRKQYEAFGQVDSITVDPHKSGYIPYPAGALCYRNGSMRNLVSFTAPVVYHGGFDPTVGVYGVEGSKPGAAAAGVYLSHRVIPVNSKGYGKILGKCFWNSKRLYAEVITMAGKDDPFIVVPVQRLPAEKQGKSPGEIKRQLDFIDRQIVTRRSNEELIQWFNSDPESWKLFREMGSDQIIISYSFNFKRKNGELNTDIDLCNKLNFEIFRKLSLHDYNQKKFGEVPKVPMFVTQSSFDAQVCGRPFVDEYARRLGLDQTSDIPITFLISTTQDPWITNTADGNFIPNVVGALHKTVLDCVKLIHKEYPEQS